MTIFLYKVLTRNSEIGNNPVLVLSNIWILGRVRVTKFDRTDSNEKLLNCANSRFTAFTFSKLSRENHQGGKNTPHPDEPLTICIHSSYFGGLISKHWVQY